MLKVVKGTLVALAASLPLTISTGVIGQGQSDAELMVRMPTDVGEKAQNGSEELLKRIRLHQLRFWRLRLPGLDIQAILNLALVEIDALIALLEGWDGDPLTLPDELQVYVKDRVLTQIPDVGLPNLDQIPVNTNVVDDVEMFVAPLATGTVGQTVNSVNSLGSGLAPTLGGGYSVPSIGGLSLPSTGSFSVPDTGSIGIPDVGSIGVPDVGSIGIPDVGSIGIPDVGSIGIPDVGSIGIPDVGSIGVPDIPGAPELPLVPDVPSLPEVPLVDPGDVIPDPGDILP